MYKKLIRSMIPQNIIHLIIRIKNNYLDGYAKKSYAQEGEDMILRRIFGAKKNGFFVDVGAHHPKRFSNTYHLYKKGWTGINIDAMPGSMKLFNKLRPNDTNIETPVSDKKELMTYYGFTDPALNGFSKELSEDRDSNSNYKIKFTKEMKTKTLEEILDSSLPKNTTINFFSIDAEGLDFQVLKSNNFKKYHPQIILIEVLSQDLSNIENSAIGKYLKEYNYSFFAKTVNTVFFKDNNFRL